MKRYRSSFKHRNSNRRYKYIIAGSSWLISKLLRKPRYWTILRDDSYFVSSYPAGFEVTQYAQLDEIFDSWIGAAKWIISNKKKCVIANDFDDYIATEHDTNFEKMY